MAQFKLMALNEKLADLWGMRKARWGTSLWRMRCMLNRLRISEKWPAIHVAGTNGKGSVCAALESGFRAMGLRTGLFTSPHLRRPNERIRVDGKCISDGDFERIYDELLPQIREFSAAGGASEISGFEMLTLMALFYFRDFPLNVLLLEVGIGGRWDATNVILPRFSAITSIGWDHEELLGHTLGKIASEKAGIIKPGIPVVIGNVPPEAMGVIVGEAFRKNAPMKNATAVSELRFSHLDGLEQKCNLPVVEVLGKWWIDRWGGDWNAFCRGVAETRWPGRWDRRILWGKWLILDGTHNGGAEPFLRQNLLQLRQHLRAENAELAAPKLTFLTNFLGVSRAEALLPTLGEFADRLLFVPMDDSRALNFERWKALIPVDFPGEIDIVFIEKIAEFLVKSSAAAHIVTGSIHLVGNVMESLNLPWN